MKVALIEDDAAVRQSLTMLLEQADFTISGFESAEEFLKFLKRSVFDCIVTDVRLGGISGIELLRELTARKIRTPVVFITGHGDIAMAVRAIKEGAADFLEKPLNVESLIDCIREAVPGAAKRAEQTPPISELQARLSKLTKREREVLQLVVNGYSTKEIAAKLGISPRTVENYRAWGAQGMGARNLADLIRKTLLLEQEREK